MRKKGFTKRNWIGLGCIIICLLLSLVMHLIRQSWISGMEDQQMAERWNEEGGVSQISCFFSREAGITEERLIGFEHTLENALKEASIVLETENSGARLWTDAYSASGTLSVSTERATLNLKAIGIGGDFFQFHPMELLYGNYFSGNDLNTDYVVIDEETAWQLYGGIDVSGKFVTIGGRPHMIAGVIHRPQGRMEKAAGLDDSIIYVHLHTLQSFGYGAGSVENYEIVMPNPIKQFALQKVKEGLAVDEKEFICIENTGRFSTLKCLEILLQFGYRSMNGRAIIYPYWENIARGFEDRLSLVTLVYVIGLIIPAGILFFWVIGLWRHKSWTFGQLIRKGSDLIYKVQSDIVIKKERAKNKKDRKPIRVFHEEEKENDKEQ